MIKSPVDELFERVTGAEKDRVVWDFVTHGPSLFLRVKEILVDELLAMKREDLVRAAHAYSGKIFECHRPWINPKWRWDTKVQDMFEMARACSWMLAIVLEALNLKDIELEKTKSMG